MAGMETHHAKRTVRLNRLSRRTSLFPPPCRPLSLRSTLNRAHPRLQLTRRKWKCNMPEQIDAWTRSVELGREIETWARAIAPVVKLAADFDATAGAELKKRVAERYLEEHPDAHGLEPLLLQRICAAILAHGLSEADDAQPQSLGVARARVRAAREQCNHRVPDQRDQAFDETVRQIKEFWASSLDEWAPQKALSVKLIAPVDAAVADEVKRRLVADRAATCPHRSDGDDRRMANALMIVLDEAIARLSVIGDSEAKAA